MLSKTKRARAAKAAPRRKAVKKLKPAAEITHEDVVHLEVDAARQTRSEQTWLSMTSAAPSREEDHWSGVEEHLLAKGADGDADRRWKYFSK